MLYVVTGGSGSGKSEYAEQMLCSLCRNGGGGTKVYLATMIPFGEETKKKIARHRRMRQEKDFLTMERYADLEIFAEQDLMALQRRTGGKLFLLLECMSNLIANEMFEKHSPWEEAVARVTAGVGGLEEVCRDVVVVTNEVCSECTHDTPEMRQYKQALGVVNCWMAGRAGKTFEVVYGTALELVPGMGGNQGKMEEKRQGSLRHLIIGGAFQGKQQYAKKKYPDIQWTDGRFCPLDQIDVCGGIFHFEVYVRRLMELWREKGQNMAKGRKADEREDVQGEDVPKESTWKEERAGLSGLAGRIAERNPGIVIVCDEIGYGLVPVDAFEREYREQTGRICTELAGLAERVERVVCGIPVTLKEENRDEDGIGADASAGN